MKNMVYCILILCLSGFLCSCQDSSLDGRTSIERKIDDYRPIQSNQFLTLNSGSLEGTGNIIFTTPLSGIFRPHIFYLNFTLNNVNSRAEFIFFHSDTSMNDGVSIEFLRAPEFKVWLHQSGRPSYELSSFFSSRSTSLPFQIKIAIFSHLTSGLRILIWDNRYQTITQENAIFDSAKQNWILDPVKAGHNWSIRMRNITLNRSFVRNYYPQ